MNPVRPEKRKHRNGTPTVAVFLCGLPGVGSKAGRWTGIDHPPILFLPGAVKAAILFIRGKTVAEASRQRPG